MKIVIAPDSFKESLSASDVATAMAAGALEACPDAVIDVCPIADGGEGTVEAVIAAAGGQTLAADVFDPLGAPIRARFALVGADTDAALPGQLGLMAAMQRRAGEGAALDASAVAVVEMAAASGLAMVAAGRRDPLRASSLGTGQLIAAALEAGARRIVVGLGDSATIDGGCGCAQALGVRFMLADGQEAAFGLGGGALETIEDIDISARDERLAETQILAACDVNSPLLGARGAAVVYGPQKGATAEMVQRLEAGLTHLAGLVRDRLGLDVAALAGAGAAGGLGAGLAAFADATLEDGFQLIAEVVSLPKRLASADLCLTGEGVLDSQSSAGKAAFGVARLAAEAGVPVVCIPGRATDDAPREAFVAVVPLVAGDITPAAAMAQAQSLLRRRAAEAVAAFGRRR